MRRKSAHGLAKSLIVDVDAAICRIERPAEDRHSAWASAALLAVRLLGGACVNVARIADALDDIADKMCTEEEPVDTDRKPI